MQRLLSQQTHAREIPEAFATNNTNSYVKTIRELTPTSRVDSIPAVVTDNPNLAILYSPLLVYGSVILFFIIFIGLLATQAFLRSLDLRRISTSLVVALIIAVTPLLVRTALQTTTIHTKAASDQTPKNVEIMQKNKHEVVVSWHVGASRVGMVRYGTAPLTQNFGQTVISNNGQKSTVHQVQLEKLQVGVRYELEILSGNGWYNDDGKPIQFVIY
ncbi:hypothetical protein C4579_02270 [Candidatus Microgenomates bacterium]|nr:MAG: hypothetical protein C4579_02270 [Candidatus Microgenomates bacterium]